MGDDQRERALEPAHDRAHGGGPADALGQFVEGDLLVLAQVMNKHGQGRHFQVLVHIWAVHFRSCLLIGTRPCQWPRAAPPGAHRVQAAETGTDHQCIALHVTLQGRIAPQPVPTVLRVVTVDMLTGLAKHKRFMKFKIINFMKIYR